jgi:hypothetical protein
MQLNGSHAKRPWLIWRELLKQWHKPSPAIAYALPEAVMRILRKALRHRSFHCIGSFIFFTAFFFPYLNAQTDSGPYARIGILLPHDEDTVDFEAGYIRHLEWHRQAKDPWIWYGWTISLGDRQRGFVYATFAHSAASLDHPVTPAEDERDTISNITPHAHFAGAGIYEFLPALSRGSGVPQPTLRVEFTTVELAPGGDKVFEEALASQQPSLQGETLWFRKRVGGNTPCYLRLRPRQSFSAILESQKEQALPDKVSSLTQKTTVEVLTLRPNMSYGLTPARQ